MTYVLDRFEDRLALFSPDGEGEQLTRPRAEFEAYCEGDVFSFSDGILTFEKELTEKRRTRIRERFRRLVKRKPKNK